MASPVDVLDPANYVSAMAAAARVLEAHAGALDMLDRRNDDARTAGSQGAKASHAPTAGSGASPAWDTDAISAGGTGSDLASTLSAAVASAESCRDFAAASRAMSEAATASAVGRGGRALAAFLGGLAEVFTNADRIDATRFALGLEAGAERLAPRDDGRHPGGFAAVANAAADAALDSADRGSELGEAILAAAGAGIEELERGPVLDAQLASRGSVDSAAAGLLLVLDSIASVVTGEPLPEPPDGTGGDTPIGDRATGEPASDVPGTGGTRSAVRYGIGCRLLPDDAGVEAQVDLEDRLSELCDSHRIDGAPTEGWSIQLETPAPGAVVELLAGIGTLREMRIAVTVQASVADPGSPLVGAGG